jgi:hypothetical protein
VERGRRHGVSWKRMSFQKSRCRGPEGGAELRAGWRDSCKRAFISNPTKEANHQNRRTNHDFTQHSVIRRRTSVSEVVPGWKGPFREGPTRLGTATDYGCCESKRSGDGHSAGVPAGRGEAGVKWPWMQEARQPARSSNSTDQREAGLSGKTL